MTKGEKKAFAQGVEEGYVRAVDRCIGSFRREIILATGQNRINRIEQNLLRKFYPVKPEFGKRRA